MDGSRLDEVGGGIRMEHVACPLCGSEAATTLYRCLDRLKVSRQPFHLVRCAGCGLVYQNPRVAPECIGAFYPSTYYSTRPGRDAGAARESERMLRRKTEIVARVCPRPGALLEVGSANGDWLVRMREAGWGVEGVEVSEDAAEYSRRTHGVAVHAGPLTTRPDPGKRFDLVAMWAVLPHIPDPVPTLHHAAGLLAPGGRLLVCCANVESIAANASGADWGHLDQPRHYCMYAPDTLARLLETEGLRGVEVAGEDGLWSPKTWLPGLRSLARLEGGDLASRVLRRGAALANRALARPVDRWARRTGRSGIIVATAHKP